MLKRILAHDRAKGLDLDDPRLASVRRDIIREKKFLNKLYMEWYGLLASAIPDGDGGVLELGSGGGFFKEFFPPAVTSDVMAVKGNCLALDGRALPFKTGSLKAIVATNTLHHIPDIALFFEEAGRCLRPGGAIAVIEPWMSPWPEFVYRKLHHEPLDKVGGWEFPSKGPLSSANGALPWIIFERDSEIFKRRFPEFSIIRKTQLMPVSYLLSGGVSLKSLAPGSIYKLVRWMEETFLTRLGMRGMFIFAVSQKRG